MPPAITIALARIRVPALATIIVLLLLEARFRLLPVPWIVVWLAAMAVIVALLRVGSLRRTPSALRVPVEGRWRVHNGPASRVPSHGVQSYGQAYAIDLVSDSPGGLRPRFGWWPPARRAWDFPGFGAPVTAPCDGVVARTHDGERDHWSRTSPVAILYMFTVELFRDLFGPNKVLGNHVVIAAADGSYAALAHLRRNSIRVGTGQRVVAGKVIAECGNSGNSSEPHLHLQVMDHPRPAIAAGVPFRFVDDEGATVPVPRNGGFVVGPPITGNAPRGGKPRNQPNEWQPQH